jgi:hypothetical protein
MGLWAQYCQRHARSEYQRAYLQKLVQLRVLNIKTIKSKMTTNTTVQ